MRRNELDKGAWIWRTSRHQGVLTGLDYSKMCPAFPVRTNPLDAVRHGRLVESGPYLRGVEWFDRPQRVSDRREDEEAWFVKKDN